MSQKTSEVWKFFKLVGADRAQCDFCKKLFSYKNSSTSNLKKHLLMHPGLNAVRPPAVVNELNDVQCENDEDVVMVSMPPPAVRAGSPAPDQRPEAPADSNAPSVRPSAALQRRPAAQKQQTLAFSQRNIPSTEKRKYDLLVLKMIVRDLQPFSVVDDAGFKELIGALCPSYVLPSRTTLSRQYLPSRYADMEIAAQNLLAAVDHVTLTTDIWTSRTTQAYMAITAHFIDANWSMQTLLLGCPSISGSHTGVRIRDELIKVKYTFKIICGACS